jgi:hypothetical protein
MNFSSILRGEKPWREKTPGPRQGGAPLSSMRAAALQLVLVRGEFLGPLGRGLGGDMKKRDPDEVTGVEKVLRKPKP